MKLVYLASLFFWVTSAFAERLIIHSIQDQFIKFHNGEVGFYRELPPLSNGDTVEVSIDGSRNILSIVPTSPLKLPRKSLPGSLTNDFSPSELPDYSSARRLMNSFRSGRSDDSQCYDRAHVWTYEAMKTKTISLTKKWIFFADHFIQKYKFKWWFHVAPVALVRMNGEVTERIMDREFADVPLKVKLWTDIFLESKKECQEIQVYTDYSRHPGEADCYLISSTPYFWQPRDLEEFANSGLQKLNFYDWEIDWAYEHSFGIKRPQ